MVRGPHGPLLRDRGRVRSAKGGCHSRDGRRNPRSKAGHISDPNRLSGGRRSGRRGYVDSLVRPGGNITGLSLQQTDVASKRVGLLREAVPGLRRLAIMANVGNSNAVLELGGAHAAARTLGLEAATSELRRAEDIMPAFEAPVGGKREIQKAAAGSLFRHHEWGLTTAAYLSGPAPADAR